MDFSCCTCSGPRKRPKKKLKITPSELQGCANKECKNRTTFEKIQEWRPVIAGNHVYYFCSDQCWAKWLTMAISTRPSLDISSPVTPAIHPYTPPVDIPMLNI